MYNLRSEDVERHLFIISCVFIVILLIGSVISLYNYRIRLREIREARDPSKKLDVALMNDHLKEVKGQNKRLETSYESLIRKHKINAIALNEQIKELQEEVAKWKLQSIPPANLELILCHISTCLKFESFNSSTNTALWTAISSSSKDPKLKAFSSSPASVTSLPLLLSLFRDSLACCAYNMRVHPRNFSVFTFFEQQLGY
uniref:Uncharacterized protein n=1 Tax=Glossina austeni TaxID=7395 RepID=A0A1A9UN15_GLOAU